MNLRASWELLKEAGNGWLEDKAQRLAAALAYYTILSVAPLLAIVLGIAGLVFGKDVARKAMLDQAAGLVGGEGAAAINTMLQNTGQTGSGIATLVVGVVMLLFGASGVFSELQDALNTVWEVTPRPGRAVWTIVRERFLSFAMILGIGFLLLVSLVVSAALAALVRLTHLDHIGLIGHVVSFCVSFAVITLLFAMIYKVLPDVHIAWGDVWVGAVGTSLLFTVGKLLIGLYLGHASVGSYYGAAGSLVVFVVWIYYSALILYFGAEFTRAYANRFGSHIRPARSAVPLTQQDRIQQGIPRQADVEKAAGQR